MEDRARTNCPRRIAGFLVGVSPVVLLAVSIAYGSAHSKMPRPIGFALVAIGAFVASLNFYLSFLRGFLHRLRQGSTDGYQHVSGFPIIGTLLVVCGGLISFGSAPIAVLGLITLLLDTGGSLWFLASTWRDSSFWDE